MTPAWLPPLLDTDGDWQRIVVRLYAAFCEDFNPCNLTLNGLPVTCDMRRCEDGWEEGFWHLITGFDQDACERLVETERARRLAWCGAVIRNAGDDAIANGAIGRRAGFELTFGLCRRTTSSCSKVPHPRGLGATFS